MTCQTCTHWNPKRAGQMARHGYGCCALSDAWRTFAPTHSCAKHKAADAPVVAARVSWLAKLDTAQSRAAQPQEHDACGNVGRGGV